MNGSGWTSSLIFADASSAIVDDENASVCGENASVDDENASDEASYVSVKRYSLF